MGLILLSPINRAISSKLARVHILDGAIEEDAGNGGLQSRNWRHKRRTAGGQDQLIVFSCHVVQMAIVVVIDFDS